MDFQDLQDRVCAWRDEKLDATLDGSIEHLIEEVEDLKENPYDPLSIADCFILLMSVCDYVDFNMEEVATAVKAKMVVNESRLWNKADSQGIVRHLEETNVV